MLCVLPLCCLFTLNNLFNYYQLKLNIRKSQKIIFILVVSEDASAQAALAKTVNSYSVRPEDILTGEHEQKFDPISLLEIFKSSRLTSVIGESTAEFVGKSSDARLANNDFVNNESR